VEGRRVLVRRKRVARITIDLPAELLNSIDERCGKTTPSISRSEFIHFALADFLQVEEAIKKEKARLFWSREETEEELDAWVEQASMIGLQEFYKDEPPWPDVNE
jgi:metal-responsive CopG/Arc/MetJ family transcriptional regulator